MTKFKKVQKENLEHFIINALTNREASKLLKLVNCTKEDMISMPKEDAACILNCLFDIREYILSLPIEEEYKP